MGATFKVHLDNGLTALVTKQAIEDLGLEIGEVVCTSFKASSIKLNKKINDRRDPFALEKI